MRKTAGIIALTTVAIAVLVMSCYYDNEEQLYPRLSTGCDTLNVTFSTTILPILSSYCWSCHSDANAASFGNNIPLQTYSEVSSNARMYGAVAHLAGYSAMPKNGGSLSDCAIRQMAIWKNHGSPP